MVYQIPGILKINYDRESAILNLIYPSLKLHILFYSNDLAIWHGLPDIRHIKVNYDR